MIHSLFIHYDISCCSVHNGNTLRLLAYLTKPDYIDHKFVIYFPQTSYKTFISRNYNLSEILCFSHDKSLLLYEIVFKGFSDPQFLSYALKPLFFLAPSIRFFSFTIFLKKLSLLYRLCFHAGLAKPQYLSFQWLYASLDILPLYFLLSVYSDCIKSKAFDNVCFDLCDCTSYFYLRYKNSSPWRSLYLSYIGFQLWFFECFLSLSAASVCFINNLESNRFFFLKPRLYPKTFFVLPNQAERELLTVDYSQESYLSLQSIKRIGIIANWDWHPNHKMLDAFLDFSINFPSKEFFVAGIGTLPANISLTNKNVRILGVVKDVSKFYEHIDAVLIWPSYVFGVQNKVIEAIKYRKPVLCNQLIESSLNIDHCPYVLAFAAQQDLIVLLHSID